MKTNLMIHPSEQETFLLSVRKSLFNTGFTKDILLSHRESEILHHFANGKTRSEIARVLFISVDTVKTHLKMIYRKLGVHDRKEALEKINSKGFLHSLPALDL